MKVLVTGGAGFIGSHLVRSLAKRSEVIVLDNFSGEVARLKSPEDVESEHVTVINGDVRDSDLLTSLLATGVDCVVHLAARSGVRQSLTNSVEYESINVGGTATLLDALREVPGVPLVFASSSSVYGARTDGPFKETDAADHPASPYAATKRAGELLCYSAHHNWGLDVTCLRFFTVYGPGQRPGMAIAKFVNQLMHGEPLTLYGDGSSTRDYTWIGDAIKAVQAAMEKAKGFEVVNIGSDRPISLSDLVALIGDVTGVELTARWLPDQDGDVPKTHADISHAAATLGWKPTMSLEDGIRRYVEWVRGDSRQHKPLSRSASSKGRVA